MNRTIKVLQVIAADMDADAKAFDGKHFDGKTVAQYFAHQGAAIAALADIVAEQQVTDSRGIEVYITGEPTSEA